MAATTKFIARTDFASYADISAYLANAYIDRYILSAQRNHIRPILGDAVHDALQTAVAASTTTTDDDNLLAKIEPVLVYRAMQMYLGFSKVYLTNMGPRVLNDEQSREATDAEVQRIAAHCKKQAEIYTAELWEYLDDNKDTYTTWRDDTQRWSGKKGISGLTAVRARDTADRRSVYADRDF